MDDYDGFWVDGKDSGVYGWLNGNGWSCDEWDDGWTDGWEDDYGDGNDDVYGNGDGDGGGIAALSEYIEG